MSGLNGMTVAELIEALSQIPEEQQKLHVVFACDYGDHCHTQQALSVKNVESSKTLVESAYSASGWALPSDDDDYEEGDEDEGFDDDQNLEYVVVLS